MLGSKWKFKDVHAFNGEYVKVLFNNGQTDAEGTLRVSCGTIFYIEQRFDDVIIDCQYDVREVEEIILIG